MSAARRLFCHKWNMGNTTLMYWAARVALVSQGTSTSQAAAVKDIRVMSLIKNIYILLWFLLDKCLHIFLLINYDIWQSLVALRTKLSEIWKILKKNLIWNLGITIHHMLEINVERNSMKSSSCNIACHWPVIEWIKFLSSISLTVLNTLPHRNTKGKSTILGSLKFPPEEYAVTCTCCVVLKWRKKDEQYETIWFLDRLRSQVNVSCTHNTKLIPVWQSDGKFLAQVVHK